MKRLMGIMLMVGAGLTLGACEKKDEKSGGSANTGVKECDEYITKYEKCLSGMPTATKSTMEQAFQAQRDGFKTSASTPEGKETLKSTCKTMLDSLKDNPACK